jgi:hypothetical protein
MDYIYCNKFHSNILYSESVVRNTIVIVILFCNLGGCNILREQNHGKFSHVNAFNWLSAN